MEGRAAEFPVEVGDFVHEQVFHVALRAVLLEDDVDEEGQVDDGVDHEQRDVVV